MPVIAAYVGLGGNLGDAAATCARAMEALDSTAADHAAARVAAVPHAALGQDRPAGLRQRRRAARDHACAARVLLDALLAIERASAATAPPTAAIAGARARSTSTCCCYGDDEIDEPGLHLPHPHLHERAFVLVPLAEIAPDTRDSRARPASRGAGRDGRRDGIEALD